MAVETMGTCAQGVSQNHDGQRQNASPTVSLSRRRIFILEEEEEEPGVADGSPEETILEM